MNIRVYEDAEQRAMLVNVVDVPPLCNFILPAIVRTGPLAIAISTAGASPALAKRMKAEVAELFGEEYATLAIMLNDVRGWAKGTLPTYQDRKEFFEGIVNGEPDPIALLRAGDTQAVRDLIAAAQSTATPPAAQSSELTHLDEHGTARMVDVGDKPATDRRAVARAVVRMSPETAAKVLAGDAPKGDVLGTARIAGILAAKRTGELIPLCHPLGLDHVDVDAEVDAAAGTVTLTAEARVTARTGVEMEAMTAASVAALTVYDMVKGLERGVEIALGRAGREVGRAQRHLAPRRLVPVRTRPRRATLTGDAHRGPHDLDVRRAPRGRGRLRPAARPPRRGGGRRRRVAMEVMPDDFALIEDRLHHYVDDDFAFVFTTGGTGLTPDDVTPEATRAVIEREAPGIAEAMRAASLRHTPMGMLARGMAGIADRTLIVNFPGNPKAIERAVPGDRAGAAPRRRDPGARGGRAAGGH